MIHSLDKDLYRGPRPESLDGLKALGVKGILCLEEGWWELLTNRLYQEDNSAETNGIAIAHARLSDVWAPSRDQVQLCLCIIAGSLNFGAVYVHCKAGVDRTGFICAAWRVVKQNWSVDQAVAEWKALGFHQYRFFWWESGFRKMMRDWGTHSS